MRLFIYGSIKKGFFNHERFGFDKLPFLGEETLQGYLLISLGAYPGIIATGGVEGDKSTVKGEIYEISQESKEFKFLAEVESLAGYSLRKVKGPDPKKRSEDIYAFIYQMYEGTEPVVPGGEWLQNGIR